jgi:hypothetical protein
MYVNLSANFVIENLLENSTEIVIKQNVSLGYKVSPQFDQIEMGFTPCKKFMIDIE